jgi:hypothetical protein
VDWAGNLTCVGLVATNGTFSGTLNGASGTFTGKIVSGEIESSKITGGSISIGDNFSVDTNGNLTANNGTFTGTITASNISDSSYSGGTSGSGGYYSFGDGGTVDVEGKITATSGKIGEWYINTALTSN